jgi:hypothetical protein
MRQEKTMKVIANHFIDPRIVLTPNAGNDKSWVFVAFDFSSGELVETVSAFRRFVWCRRVIPFSFSSDHHLCARNYNYIYISSTPFPQFP